MESGNEYPMQQGGDSYSKVRDIEDKIRLLKDRVLLIGQTHIEEREKTFNDVQELKKIVFKLAEDNLRMKELLQRITEQLNSSARKEELAILQRQFDLFRHS